MHIKNYISLASVGMMLIVISGCTNNTTTPTNATASSTMPANSIYLFNQTTQSLTAYTAQGEELGHTRLTPELTDILANYSGDKVWSQPQFTNRLPLADAFLVYTDADQQLGVVADQTGQSLVTFPISPNAGLTVGDLLPEYSGDEIVLCDEPNGPDSAGTVSIISFASGNAQVMDSFSPFPNKDSYQGELYRLCHSLAVADLNHDGINELVIGAKDPADSSAGMDFDGVLGTHVQLSVFNAQGELQHTINLHSKIHMPDLLQFTALDADGSSYADDFISNDHHVNIQVADETGNLLYQLNAQDPYHPILEFGSGNYAVGNVLADQADELVTYRRAEGSVAVLNAATGALESSFSVLPDDTDLTATTQSIFISPELVKLF